jgi:hypothetical protein
LYQNLPVRYRPTSAVYVPDTASREEAKRLPAVAVVLVGNVDAAAKAAGELCDEGPHLKPPYEAKKVVAHIKWLLAASRRQVAPEA